MNKLEPKYYVVTRQISVMAYDETDAESVADRVLDRGWESIEDEVCATCEAEGNTHSINCTENPEYDGDFEDE